jgi:hypothetical protein
MRSQGHDFTLAAAASPGSRRSPGSVGMAAGARRPGQLLRIRAIRLRLYKPGAASPAVMRGASTSRHQAAQADAQRRIPQLAVSSGYARRRTATQRLRLTSEESLVRNQRRPPAKTYCLDPSGWHSLSSLGRALEPVLPGLSSGPGTAACHGALRPHPSWASGNRTVPDLLFYVTFRVKLSLYCEVAGLWLWKQNL